MRVAKRRWGEVTLKKQAAGKNKFDKSRSFSIIETGSSYDIEELKTILEIVVNMTDEFEFEDLKSLLAKYRRGREGAPPREERTTRKRCKTW